MRQEGRAEGGEGAREEWGGGGGEDKIRHPAQRIYKPLTYTLHCRDVEPTPSYMPISHTAETQSTLCTPW